MHPCASCFRLHCLCGAGSPRNADPYSRISGGDRSNSNVCTDAHDDTHCDGHDDGTAYRHICPYAHPRHRTKAGSAGSVFAY